MSITNTLLLLLRGEGMNLNAPGAPKLIKTVINDDGAGSETTTFVFNRYIESPTSDYMTGFTIQVSPDNSDWRTLDPATLTGARVATQQNKIRITQSHDNDIIQRSHLVRSSYSGGNIRNQNDATALANYTNDTNISNLSIYDLLGKHVQSWPFSEGSGADRQGIINETNDLDKMLDAGTVGIDTGLLGENACDFTGDDYLSILGHSGGTELYRAPVDGKFFGCFYVKVDTFTGTQAYLMNRYSGLGTIRTMASWIDSSDDVLRVAGFDTSDNNFTVKVTNRGTFSTGTWYAIIWVFNPDTTGAELTVYTQQESTGADFKTDSTITGNSTILQCRRENTTRWAIGRIPDRADINGTDAKITLPHLFEGELSLTEAQWLVAIPRNYPFWPKTS